MCIIMITKLDFVLLFKLTLVMLTRLVTVLALWCKNSFNNCTTFCNNCQTCYHSVRLKVQKLLQMVVRLLTCCGFQLPFTQDLPLGGCFCLASTVCVLSEGVFALCGDLGGEGGVMGLGWGCGGG